MITGRNADKNQARLSAFACLGAEKAPQSGLVFTHTLGWTQGAEVGNLAPLPWGEGKDPLPTLSPRERGRRQRWNRCVPRDVAHAQLAGRGESSMVRRSAEAGEQMLFIPSPES